MRIIVSIEITLSVCLSVCLCACIFNGWTWNICHPCMYNSAHWWCLSASNTLLASCW